MAKITAPNKNYNGISATVRFVNGEGFTKDAKLIAWFKSRGYSVELDGTKEKPTTGNKK